jgi:hypothetical protein
MTPSWPYLHTLINHFPVVLTVVGTLAVLLALVYSRRSLWLYGLGTLTLAGITVYPAWLSGGKAAHAVHNAWYIERGAIHTHAEAADLTMWVVLVTGLAAVIAWASIARNRDAFAPARWLRIVVAVLAVVALCAVSYTAYRGGQIVVDSAILANPVPPTLPPSQPLPPAGNTTVPQVQQPMPGVPQQIPAQPRQMPSNPMPTTPAQPQTTAPPAQTNPAPPASAR